MFCVILRGIALVVRISNRHCEENYVVIDEAISGYLVRLPCSLRLLAMTEKSIHSGNIFKGIASRTQFLL
ncbi:hypothetical protein FEC77_01165 [Rickettsia parkeri]|nr:hypothetical protein FEC77_01165 [Rickettsia parkeri]